MPNQQDNGEPDDFASFDGFVFVPAPGRDPITATGLLNTVTANEPFLNDFANFLDRRGIDGSIQFNPPDIMSTGNGDDIVVQLTAVDLSITMAISTNADGSNTTIVITRLAMDPADFADLGGPADPDNPTDFDLNGAFGQIGFQPYDPFAAFFGASDRSFNDGNLFGSYDFFNLSGNYDSYGFGGSGGGGGGRFYDSYSTYEGPDYIFFDGF